jgi:hypothetical protein
MIKSIPQSVLDSIIEVLLLEADYSLMFPKVIGADGPDFKTSFDKQIKWAKEVLKKDDRIVWFLKQVRIVQLSLYYGTGTKKGQQKALELYPKDKKMIDSIWQSSAFGPGMPALMALKNTLQHAFSLKIATLEKIVFKDQTVNEMYNLVIDIENEWKHEHERLIPIEAIETDDKEIITFPNNWGWWLLPRESCKIEAGAMKHCGNTASAQPGDQILSLRQRVKQGNEEFLTPHLTFILRKSGFLGEMKGYGNEKPVAKYYPYIVKLLQDKEIIKGIKGGGYLPAHNFQWSDLSEEQRKEVLAKNPDFIGDIFDAPVEVLLKHKDLIKTVIDEIDENSSIFGFRHEKPSNNMMLSNGYIIVNYWSNLADFVHEYTEYPKSAGEDIDEHFNYYMHYIDNSEKYFLEALPPAIETKIRKKFKIPEDTELSDMIEDNEDFSQMVRDALYAGYASAAFWSYRNMVKQIIDDVFWPKSKIVYQENPEEEFDIIKPKLDVGLYLIIPLQELLAFWKKYKDDHRPEEVFYDTEDKKNYSFDPEDFNDKAAYEELESQLK